VNQAEYQRLRRQLDEELRAGMEMLQAGHRAKVEALDARWQEESGPIPASRAPEPREEPATAMAVPPVERERLQAGELLDDIDAALERMGDEFLKSDLCRALGYEPHRSSLHRALRELEREGVLEVQRHGLGRRASRYRKTGRGPRD
jgi:UTP:GlnB (protein PII) uridylyltransferase